MPRKVYVAKTTFATSINGKRVVVHQGATVREGHPLLSGRESLFQLASVRTDFDVVEQATAAPGEKRQLPEPEEKRGPGRPKLPRDAEGNIIRE